MPKTNRWLRPVSLSSAILLILQFQLAVGYNISSYGTPEFGLGFIWTREPILSVNVSFSAPTAPIPIAVPENVTAYGLWTTILPNGINAPLAVSPFQGQGCEIFDTRSVAGRIVLIDEIARHCEAFDYLTTVVARLNRAGAVGVIVNKTRWELAGHAFHTKAERPLPVVYAKPEFFRLLVELQQNSSILGAVVQVSMLQPPPEIYSWSLTYEVTSNLYFIMMPVLHFLAATLAVLAFAVRLINEARQRVALRSPASSIMASSQLVIRICLLFCFSASIERSLDRLIDPSSRNGIVPYIAQQVASAFTVSFNFSIITMLILWWLLLMTWANRYLTPRRVVGISVGSLVFVYVVIIVLSALGAIYTYLLDILRTAISVLIGIAIVAACAVGVAFLLRLAKSSKFDSSGSAKSHNRVKSVQIRATLAILFLSAAGIVVMALQIAQTAGANAELDTWGQLYTSHYTSLSVPQSLVLYPFIIDVMTWIIHATAAAVLFVTPQQTSSPANSSTTQV